MDRVRTLRTVFWWAGWISLALAALGILAILMMLPSQNFSAMQPGSFMPQPVLMTLVSLPYQLAFPVVLFFAWGVLTVLDEIHERLEEELDLMGDDEQRAEGDAFPPAAI